jgi:hypothetical protein
MHFKTRPEYMAFHKEACDGDFFCAFDIESKEHIYRKHECLKCKASFWTHRHPDGKVFFNVAELPKNKPTTYQNTLDIYTEKSIHSSQRIVPKSQRGSVVELRH